MGFADPQVSVEIAYITCYKCGVVFGTPASWKEKRLEHGDDFWCPNGHVQRFMETEAAKLRKEVVKLNERLAAKDNIIDLESKRADREFRRRVALKGQVTKIKNRVHNGVCPVCHRHFTALERHMKHQHPEWKDQEIESIGG